MKNLIKRKISIVFIIVFALVEISLYVKSESAEASNKNYNRELAVEYALKWATSSNSKYYNYIKDGGDCTNFVSQVLRAGGMEFLGSRETATSIKSWFYYSANLPNRSSTWTAAQPFHLHFGIENKRAHKYIEYKIIDALINWDEIYMNLLPGDIVQYSRPNNITFHSQVITELMDRKRTIYFCQHSNSIENFIKNGNLRYYLMGKPNDYNFYIYNIKGHNDNIYRNSKSNSMEICNENLTEDEYRKELVEAIHIIKVSLSDTRFNSEEDISEETEEFINKMNKRIEEIEFYMNTREKSSKDLLDILSSREGL